MSVAFVDCETTGLDPDRHEMWELAIIVDQQEYAWQLPVDLAKADSAALRIGDFYTRRVQISRGSAVANVHRVRWPRNGGFEAAGHVRDTAETVATLLDGRHLVGAVPSFDASFIAPWLRVHGQAPTWHYHLIDVENLAAGKLGVEPPYSSEDLSRAIGVPPSRYERHTALGDARWAKAIYEAVYA